MLLSVKERGSCAFDILSLGEVMLRLDPGDGRIRTARSFRVWEGGGEYNVARALRRCFGMRAGIVTSLADNEVGRLVEDLILQGGVDTSLIKWLDYDGVGRSVRNGLNFTERGFGVRGALGVSDRGSTAVSALNTGDIDWDYIFGTLGVRWFHTGGIFAALSESAPLVVLEAVKAAKKYGTVVSYDLNYRTSLWKAIGGKEKSRDVNRSIVPFADVIVGSTDDYADCLGINADSSIEFNAENPICCRRILEEAVSAYPNLKAAAATLLNVKSACINDWSALCLAGDEAFASMVFPSLELYDRVGGGDSFAAGLIYGLMEKGSADYAVNCGVAHGALSMTTPGDTSMASLKEVESLMSGNGAAVSR